jgi:hypothetical protein
VVDAVVGSKTVERVEVTALRCWFSTRAWHGVILIFLVEATIVGWRMRPREAM